jgi:3D (Asp-Asp-Asp) domain-containing protein
MKLTRRERNTLVTVFIYALIILFGFMKINDLAVDAATWERKYNTAKETEERAVELLGAKVRELDEYKAMVEQDKRMEEASRAQAMAHYEELGQYRYIGECRITHYCCESKDNPHICGTGTGLTATGVPVAPGMVAVDPKVIPLGSTVIINGVPYLAADTGVSGYAIDIAVPTHDEAIDMGTYQADVWIITE